VLEWQALCVTMLFDFLSYHFISQPCVDIGSFSCGARINVNDPILHLTEEDDTDHTEEYDPIYSVPVERRDDQSCERDQLALDDEPLENNNGLDEGYANNATILSTNSSNNKKLLPLLEPSWNKMARMSQNKLPPSATDMLLQRLAEYENIGRLSKKEYSVYRNVLEKHPGSKQYLQQISNELDQVAQEARAAEISSSQSTKTADEHEHHNYSSREEPQPHSILHDPRREALSQRKFNVSWGDQDQSKDDADKYDNDDDDDENDNYEDKANNEGSSSALILEPADVWKGATEFDEHQLQELFVEMCFFARLGFVQPPCCLQCTYRESIPKKTPKTDCQRWVVWRKDAEKLLHPNRLDGNILIIQCHVARSLLAGESVDGREWDTEQKQVVVSRNKT
jgi:hypothetical protein